MCCALRCTLKRGTASWRICERVDVARRGLAVFLAISTFSRKRIGCSFEKSDRDRPGSADDSAPPLLGFLQCDALARVTHALALVGFRRAECADLRGDFADALLVGPLDHDLG